MAQLENIEAIEKRLWNAADTLRSNSNYASNEYFMPVMGLIFLRHAYSRFLAVKGQIEASLPTRGGKVRELTKEDFSQKSSIFLRPEAQFDYLVSLPDSDNRAEKIIAAMESIEADYESLRGVLPKGEYHELDNVVLGQLLRTLNLEELKRASGDIFGRIYEYFLTGFADLKAHDNGEFFTPVSLVSLIANVLEPTQGIVFDPACGSGGMFVQSAHIVEGHHQNPSDKLTFRGLEKNPTTIRLAKMNLAVHGLEGDIQKAITYYEDPHELLGKADFVMANPPFNVDEVDADKNKHDPRLPFGLPGVNKGGKVSNGNYLWISYFYSYLNEKGRAGFVMSSQASSAGRDEALVRRKLIETGHVEIMIAIRSNFFYTRTVPCELWFLNRAKPEQQKDKILMIDARNIYRKVTRKIYDFSPEQMQNILAIVWLYRGQEERFTDLVGQYISRTLDEAKSCFEMQDEAGKIIKPLSEFVTALDNLRDTVTPFIGTLPKEAAHTEILRQWEDNRADLGRDIQALQELTIKESTAWKQKQLNLSTINEATGYLSPLAEASRDLYKLIDQLYKISGQLIDICENDFNAKESDLWIAREVAKSRKIVDANREFAVSRLKQVRYFYKQVIWLTGHFPEGKFRDVEGLVKLVNKADLSDDFSLTPGRYVGVAPVAEDEEFDFEAALRDIHIELDGLNNEAVELAAKIAKNFMELEI